jgi:glycerol-3-phosphate dehydrogenase
VILPDLSPGARARHLRSAASGTLDVLIIGGGINGVWVAYDAAQRGLSVALVEQGQFASGTSSRSSKMIHGGLRYLEHLEFGLVFESLKERGVLLAIAPNLVRRLEFVFPVWSGDRHPLWFVDAALWAYDAMSMFRKVSRHHRMRPGQVRAAVPGLRTDGLVGAIAYDDACTDDASLTLAVLRRAVACGAQVANMARVTGLVRDGGRVAGAVVEDVSGGGRERLTLRARAVVNTAGPWVDAVRRMADPGAAPLLRPTKGTHLVFPAARVPVSRAVVLLTRVDRRVVYLIPWLAYTLLGTTDTDYAGDPARVDVAPEDVEYLLSTIDFYFPGLGLSPSDSCGSFAGLRPLLVSGKGDKPSDISRRYSLTEDPPGLFTLTGGKLTTARRMAQDTLDLVVRSSGLSARSECRTAREPLLDDLPLDTLVAELAAVPGVAVESAEYLARSYGSDARHVLTFAREDRELASPIAPGHPHVLAQVPFAHRHEMIATPEAFLERYGKGGLDRVPGVRDRVARLLPSGAAATR